MKNLLIHYSMKNDPMRILYQVDLLTWIRERIGDLDIIDLDNYSDNFLVSHVVKAIQKNEKICVVVDEEPNAAPGSLPRILEELIRKRDPERVMWVFNGLENEWLRKTLKGIEGRFLFINRPELETRELVLSFFRKQSG
ncbi:MAG: hypothetical protein MI784_08435 [Cytophagales bacterium]|nr:hypothetical protein [Cytophagales bacterium]